ncbi:MAG: hypothetical protein JOY59_06495 [Candidatus Eremiobacteraeota bacterium]|nr:hypothetical protein [Candidatus Eremiobacteraeota bacterium]
METFFARTARGIPLNNEQHAIVIGSLLGDGTLSQTTAGWCFRVHHGIQQRAYVDWKYRALATFLRTPPRTCGAGYYFRTVTHPAFITLRSAFYLGRRKIVPRLLLAAELSPLALAVWIMDDGAADGRSIRINTQSFSEAENRDLLDVLYGKFGLAATLNRDKGAFRIRIPAAHIAGLNLIVAPHVRAEMRYKLPAE